MQTYILRILGHNPLIPYGQTKLMIFTDIVDERDQLRVSILSVCDTGDIIS